MNEHEAIRPVDEQDADLTGTAAADGRGGRFLGDLARMLGLDASRYSIVGMEFGEAEHDPSVLEILAVDRQDFDVNRFEEVRGATGAVVPVTAFRIHGLSLEKLLGEGLRRLDVQLLSEALPEGVTLRRVRFADIEV